MPEKKRTARISLSWDEWYKLAKQYRDAHGDLLVPKNYVCPGEERLGRWIERQRARYNDVASIDRRLHDDEIALLEQIDMVWKLEYRSEWADWLKALDWYKDVYGSIDVPKDFVHGVYSLGNWIAKQRMAYAAGQLSPAQIEDLERRGMIWRAAAPRREWNDWYRDAEAYFEAHGDLMVPPNYQTPDGHKLGLWIYQQRDVYMGRKANRSLTSKQIARLERLHMVWEPERQKHEAWDSMYACVAEYWNAHGKLPLWPRNLKSPDGRSLPGWVRTQRTALARGNVPAERVERLAAIGIRASRPKACQDEAWERMYAAVADYLSRNGSLPATHKGAKSADGRLMPRWITLQRQNMAAGRLPEDKIDRLAQLGIIH